MYKKHLKDQKMSLAHCCYISFFVKMTKMNLTVSKPFLVVNLTNTQPTEFFLLFYFSDIATYYITTKHNVNS